MFEFQKVDTPALYPQMCVICDSSKGPQVDTMIEKGGVVAGTSGFGRVYLCRLCITRAARELGLVKGDEMERLQNAADGLDQAQKEIESRQGAIEQMSERAADRDRTIAAQRQVIETLQAEAASRKHLAEQILTGARDLVEA